MKRLPTPEIGTTFGHRTVIGHTEKLIYGIHQAVTVQCSCGHTADVPVAGLIKGLVDSCRSCSRAIISYGSVEAAHKARQAKIDAYQAKVSANKARRAKVREDRRAIIEQHLDTGLSQRELAIKLGISPSMVNKILYGLR